MTLIDILSNPWAIVPERLLELQAIYATHLRGDKIDIAAIEARLGRPLANDQKAYALQDGTGVAVLEVSGVISPKANMFTRISGGAAASLLQQQVQSMAADPKVKSVVIDFDTPGGNVHGIPALATAIRSLADAKPTVAVCTGMMASAGYWLGCAASSVYISGGTDFIGSIGVVATHAYDPRKADVQTTEITAGKYKRMASERAPLTAEGRDYMQGQVDELYRVFVNAVADSRGVSAEDVLAKMADGRVFIGQQAIDAGLVDGVSTVDAMVEQLATNPGKFVARRRAVFAVPAKQTLITGTTAQTTVPAVDPGAPQVQTLALPIPVITPAAGVAAPVVPPAAGPVLPQASTHPEGSTTMTPQELAAKFAADTPDAAALLRAEGGTAERTRIQAVRDQAMPGHDKLIDALAFDGTTTGPEAAVKVLAAERTRIGQIATSRAGDAPKPVKQDPADTDTVAQPAAATSHAGFAVDPTAARLHAGAKAYMAAHPGTDYIAAVKVVQQQPAPQGA